MLFNTKWNTESDVMNITKGGKSTGLFQTSNNIHSLMFICRTAAGIPLTNAEIASDIDSLIIKYNGVTLRDVTAEQLISMNISRHDRNGQLAGGCEYGIIPINFSKPNLPIGQQIAGFALGMLNGGKNVALTYEINFKSPATLTVSSIEVQMEYDTEEERPLGLHTRIVRHNREFNSVGRQDITDLPFTGLNTAVYAYHFTNFNGAGVNKFTVKKGNTYICQGLSSNVIAHEMTVAGRTPLAGYNHLYFDNLNSVESLEPLGEGVASWVITPEWLAAPGSYTIIEEMLHNGI